MEQVTRRSFIAGAGVAAAAAATGTLAVARADGDSSEFMNRAKSEAKWEFEIAPDPIDEALIAAEYVADIIVVGSGPSGLYTAVSAAQNGADVIIITKDSGPVKAAHTTHAVNSKVMEAAGIEPYDVNQMWRKEFLAFNYKVDQRKWFKFYNNSEEAMNWLIDLLAPYGVYFTLDINTPEELIPDTDPLYMPTAAHHHSLDGCAPDYAVLPATLWDIFEGLGGRVDIETTAVQLVREDKNGRVTSVIAQNDAGDYVKYTGIKGIVLATGDFAGDPEMMARYCPDARDMVGLGKGDGQKMGLWIGAAWQRAFPNAPMMGGGNAPLCIQPYGAHRGLMVDNRGNRYSNEDNIYTMGGFAQSMLPNKECFSIWGSNYATEGGPWNPQNSAPGTPPMTTEQILAEWEGYIANGQAIKADTLEELIEGLGLPLEETMATIERYNELCEKGVDEDFHKKAQWMVAIKEGPFYGGSTSMRFLTVMGGLRTDDMMRVCDADDNPIPGLYNVGTMVGDMYCNTYTYMLQGVNMGSTCLTFGYMTGRDLANGMI